MLLILQIIVVGMYHCTYGHVGMYHCTYGHVGMYHCAYGHVGMYTPYKQVDPPMQVLPRDSIG